MPTLGIKTTLIHYPESWKDRKKDHTWLDILHLGIIASESQLIMGLVVPRLKQETDEKTPKIEENGNNILTE